MNDRPFNEKVEIFSKLLLLGKNIKATRKANDESIDDYGDRLEKWLSCYKRLGQIIRTEVREISDINIMREQLAVVAFFRGLNEDILRYMCRPSYYATLTQARRHARCIKFQLEDLRKMGRQSIQVTSL